MRREIIIKKERREIIIKRELKIDGKRFFLIMEFLSQNLKVLKRDEIQVNNIKMCKTID